MPQAFTGKQPIGPQGLGLDTQEPEDQNNHTGVPKKLNRGYNVAIGKDIYVLVVFSLNNKHT